MSRAYGSYARSWRRRMERETLRREERRRQGWEEARELARWLGQVYKVTKVGVTGSLLDRNRFRENSDLDLVVWGLPSGKYLEALDRIGSRTGFDVDLVPWSHATPHFRRLVAEHLVILYESDR